MGTGLEGLVVGYLAEAWIGFFVGFSDGVVLGVVVRDSIGVWVGVTVGNPDSVWSVLACGDPEGDLVGFIVACIILDGSALGDKLSASKTSRLSSPDVNMARPLPIKYSISSTILEFNKAITRELSDD